MRLQLDWMNQVNLTDGSSQNLIYTCALSAIPQSPGIYVFGRKYGKNIEALYVGKATSLRGRVKTQLKNLPLMVHLKNARSGARFVQIARFIPKQGQQQTACLKLVERSLIRHFMLLGHDLVNIQGTNLRSHEIASSKSPNEIPNLMFVDK